MGNGAKLGPVFFIRWRLHWGPSPAVGVMGARTAILRAFARQPTVVLARWLQPKNIFFIVGTPGQPVS